ncbi:MAG: helix-turn-helix domain-containing protein [Acidimicrobiales bacterium]
MTEKCFETRTLDRLLYSVADAAVLLSCSKNTVYSLIRSGEILPIYPTSKARITRAALERFVEKKEAEARAERQTQRSMTR